MVLCHVPHSIKKASETVRDTLKKRVVMERTKKHDWLIAQGYQRGCRREGFLARNSIGVVSPDRFSETGYPQDCVRVIHQGYEAAHDRCPEVLRYDR